MMRAVFLFSIIASLLLSCKENKEEDSARGIKKAEAFGLKLSLHSRMYSNLPLEEVFTKAEELGVKYIEVDPNHRLGEKWGNRNFGLDLTSTEQKEIKDAAAKYGVTIVSYGVYKTEKAEDWKKLFDFSKSMDFEYITCEPKYEHLDLVEQLAQEYEIEVGIYNSVAPSLYSSPDLLLSKLKNRSPLLGVCVNVGNWYESDLDQIECIMKMKGRIQSLHLKDPDPKNETDNLFYDNTWGLGAIDVDAILLELKRQDYKGYLTMVLTKDAEYVNKWSNLTPNIKESVEYYNLVADRIFEGE